MIELIIGTYGFLCWLLFAKFKVIPINTYTIFTALGGGVVLLLLIFILLSQCHPVSDDCRTYAVVVPIVPQVRGIITDVPATANKPMKMGDVLFRIDPRPYQYEVDRLEAALVGMNAKVAQLSAKLAAAEATTRLAQSNLLVSESESDRQLRLDVEKATEEVTQTKGKLDLAKLEYERNVPLAKSGAISQVELDRSRTRMETLQATLVQAQAAEKGAQEKLKSGSNVLQSAREELKRAQSQEKEIRISLEAEIGGVNPEVRQTMAELERKRWELEQTVVRAPSDGYSEQVAIRPGRMATPIQLQAPMVFIPSEKPLLVASFPQNVVAGIEPGLEAELAFKLYPGRVFKAKVKRVLPIITEGQFLATGALRTTTLETAPGRIPVVFEYDEDVSSLNLPIGSQAEVAVYTHNLHALSILRKIILRMKSWENYVFFFGH